MNLDEFLSYQKRVFAIMDRAEPILQGKVQPDPAQLEICRGQVSAALTTYQLFKHRELFPKIKDSGFKFVTAAGHDLQADCIALGNEFRAHTVKWKNRDVLRHWHEYAPRALELIKRARNQLAREAQEARRLAWLKASPSERMHRGNVEKRQLGTGALAWQ